MNKILSDNDTEREIKQDEAFGGCRWGYERESCAGVVS